MKPIEKLTNMDELRRLLALQKSGESRTIDGKAMAAALKLRVKGQDEVIDDVVRLIKLQWAKEKRKRPIANLMFVGPTGTGKTELAKAMAEYLYGDEKAMLWFDCSEFTGPESKNYLIGVPTGYHGSGQGGKLTRPMLNNPKRVVLFDEIEKAYPAVMDLFLQMMGDGRLTEQGSGETADFTQSVIILTSNAEAQVISQLQKEMTDQSEMLNAVKSHLVSTGKFRMEIMGRIDKIYVFRSLDNEVLADIIGLKMQVLAKEYGLVLEEVDPRLILVALERGNKLSKFGVRALDQQINNMLGDHFVMAKDAGAKRCSLEIDDAGDMVIAHDGAKAQVDEASSAE
jgi:ATP-dependent Clp protease ATP-binding subunit ClpA